METEAPLDLLSRLLAEPPDFSVLERPADWQVIRQHAARHGVAQLVAFVARGHVPAAERVWCDEVLKRAWTRYDQSLGQLDRTLELLEREKIPALSLKGPLLARRHYQPPFIRKPSGDIDLGILAEDMPRAAEVFYRAGYTPDLALPEALVRSHHLELSHATLPRVELHFRLSHGAFGIPIDEFFPRAVGCELPGGRKTLVLDAPDEILHLVLHRAWGRFALLFHLYEIRRIWDSATPEVRDEALRRAVTYHFAGAFALTDAAFRAHWGRPLLTAPQAAAAPTWLRSRITPGFYRTFEECSDPGRELPLATRLKRRWLDLQLTDSPADAFRFSVILAGVAAHQLRTGGWRTVRPH